MRSERVWFATVAISALTSSILSAGGLSPPSAPRSTPGPEPRTPISAETTPGDSTAFFIITRPGSYYLTGNITKPLLDDPHDGIVITSSDVTIDLNGFTMDGFAPIIIPVGPSPEPQGLGPSTTGIRADGSLENITIRNGVVRDWRAHGISLGTGSLVEGVRVVGNRDQGIILGPDSVVTRCIAQDNGGTGVIMGSGSTVTDSTSRGNGLDGFFFFSGAIRGCVARSNDRHGITGDRLLVTDCHAFSNSNSGIDVMFNSAVLNSVAQNNAGTGICVNRSNRVQGNHVANNEGFGIEATGARNTVIQNTVVGNDDGNFVFAEDNSVGPILSPANPITSTNPWANFEF